MEKNRFIVTSFIVAILFNILPWRLSPCIPDAVSLIFLFWNINQSRKISTVYSFILGTLADVQSHTLFGEHILRYLIVSQLSCYIKRHLFEVPTLLHLVFVFPILGISHLVPSVISHIISGEKIHLTILFSPFFSALIWPPLVALINYYKKNIIMI